MFLLLQACSKIYCKKSNDNLQKRRFFCVFKRKNAVFVFKLIDETDFLNVGYL